MSKVLVFGSINIDFVTHVPNIVTPGETIAATRPVDVFMGGKGANQAIAAAKAGGDVTFCGAVGFDGGDALNNFTTHNINTKYIHRSDDIPTGSAYIQLDAQGENAIIVNPNANGLACADNIDDEALRGFDIIVMQMEVPHSENWALIKRARTMGVKTMLNLAPFAPLNTEVLAQLDYLVVNEGEFTQLSNHLGLTGDHMAMLTTLSTQYPQLSIVISLGSKGAQLCTAQSTITIPALAVDPIDTTGAGDAMCGALAAALVEGLCPEDALKWGIVAGSLACTKLGAQSASPHKTAILSKL